MTPVIAYFVMIGWSKVIQNFPKNKQTFLSIILTIILLCSIMLSLNSLYSNPIASGQNFKIIPSNNSFIFETSTQPGSGALYSETYNTQNDVKRASEWLKTYDKEYLSKNIYADYFWPHFSWFLKKGVFGLADRNNLNLELRKSNVEYFIALRYYDLADYKIVYESQTSYGYIIIYKKI
jgi:hypothetical protein